MIQAKAAISIFSSAEKTQVSSRSETRQTCIAIGVNIGGTLLVPGLQ